jgi:GTP cyclohydrolase FolE2
MILSAGSSLASTFIGDFIHEPAKAVGYETDYTCTRVTGNRTCPCSFKISQLKSRECLFVTANYRNLMSS